MRELARIETQTISGGFVCVDSLMLQTIHSQAINDGTNFALISDTLIMAATYGIVANAMAAGMAPGLMAAGAVGIVAAPYLGIVGYTYSSSWKILNLQIA